MKKILLVTCLVAISVTMFAQSSVKYGVKAGVNLTNLRFIDKGYQDVGAASDMLTSFSAGIIADYKVSKSVSLQPALLFTGKGANTHVYGFEGFTTDTYTKQTIYYLQLPINVLYHLPVGNHDLHFGGGPFLSYAMGGKNKGTTTKVMNNVKTITEFDDKVKFGNNSSDDLKRMDYGVEFLAGLKFKNGFLININYDLGLVNIDPSGFPHTKTTVFGLSVGYVF